MATETEKQLKRIADALNRAYPPTDASFADGTQRLTGVELALAIARGVAHRDDVLMRRLSEQPQPEGDWLLETERAEAGDDVD